jgi:hypothetical protein
MALSNKHHWIGLFGADGNLRDNFLMYIGTDPESTENSYCISLCALGKIQPKHLFHGGCQILAETNRGLANLASVKPFTVGDHFRLIGEDEHMELIGKEDHEDELSGIKRILTHTVNQEIISLDDRYYESKQAQTANDTCSHVEIPALDGFLPDLQNAPEWLKNYATFCIKSNSPCEVAELIGFLSRTGDANARKLGAEWAKKHSQKQLMHLSKANIEKLFALADASVQLEQATNVVEEKQLASNVAMILTMRDQCESIFWIMEEAGSPPLRSLSGIEESLLSNPLLFTTPLRNKASWMVQMLVYIREHSPVCWWAARANLV